MPRKITRHSTAEYKAGILAGDRVMLSQAITLIESQLTSDYDRSQDVIEACLPHTGKAFRIGITGPPGVGKSTFVERFGMLLVEAGKKVAVLAVDPSSQKSHGSILGDKTRMHSLVRHDQVFVRPSPAGDTLGGLSRKSRESMLLCEAAGFDVVLVETVGVGQSETAVHSMVDFFLLLLLPNSGDELQGIKKGIMEMADALVIHKSDGPHIAAARKSHTAFAQALRLLGNPRPGWSAKVLKASSVEVHGHAEIWALMEKFRKEREANGAWTQNRTRQALDWFRENLHTALLKQFEQSDQIGKKMRQLEEAIISQTLSPVRAAEQLLSFWLENDHFKKP